MRAEELEGILLIDKPRGPTSHDVVQRVKNALSAQKAGHLGTLDPAATGLLAVCINGATKIAQFLVGLDKEYRGTLKLGVETDTQDAEGEVVADVDPDHLTGDEIKGAFAGFLGPVLQRPPAYSAVKQGGVPLYKLARAGKKAVAPVKAVHVSELEIEKIDMPRVTFRACVSTGTYIRTLAHDIGRELGVGAHLESLRRLKIGRFRIEDAIPLDELSTGTGLSKAHSAMIPLSDALADWPEILLKGDAARRVAHGSGLTSDDFESGEARMAGSEGDRAKAVDYNGRLIAVMEKTGAGGRSDEDKGLEPLGSEKIILWKSLRVWG